MQDHGKSQIWRGLVDYANAPDLSNPEALNNLARTLSDCMPWMSGIAIDDFVPEMIALRVNRDALFGHVGEKRVWLSFKTEEQLADEFRQQAIEYQPQVRQLLAWLSDRDRNAQDRPFVFEFLRGHMKHIEFQPGEPGFAPEEEDSRYFTAQGEPNDDFPHQTLLYKDLADVICDFVQREHDPGTDVPIRTCKRPGCGNLVTRIKKREYCRTSSCDRERQKRDDDIKRRKNRDSVFLCRLRKMLRDMSPAMRGKKIRESTHRLRDIESYWRDTNQSFAERALELLKKR